MSSETRSEPATAPLAPVIARPDNLTSLVFAAIRDKIVDASLPPGSSLSEAMLAARLNVSKTPVREALLRLRHLGLVEPTTRGLRVTQPSAIAIRNAFEFRAGIEEMAARYAAVRATGRESDQIAELAGESLEAAREGRPAEFSVSDRDFHLAVAGAAHNEILAQAIEDAFILTLALRQRDVHVERDFVPDACEHVQIAELIRAGAGAQAGECLAGHVRRIMAQLLEAFPQS